MAVGHITAHGMSSMNDSVFIDTNILLYAYDRDAGVKHEIARKLMRQCWEKAIGVISIQVLCEFFARATRTGSSIISLKEAQSIINNISNNWRVIPPDVQMVLEAIKGRIKYQFSFWDALIWAAAKRAGVRKLYTEDFQSGQIVEGVKFINPFKVGNKLKSK